MSLRKELRDWKMTTITIKQRDSEVSITREAESLEDLLELMEDALKALGYCFKGELNIVNEDV